MAEVYRKIRNTIRYILGNTNDFDYEKDGFKEIVELPVEIVLNYYENRESKQGAFKIGKYINIKANFFTESSELVIGKLDKLISTFMLINFLLFI